MRNDIERVAHNILQRITFAEHRHWNYLRVLEALHREVMPRWYFEIGVRRGESLRLAQCPAIGVDPSYDLDYAPRGDTILFDETSDDFFKTVQLNDLLGIAKIDFAFIDGWHNAEFALRDFINIEPFCSRDGLVVFDDVLPRTRDQAVRTPHGRAWSGDIWKVAECLIEHRTDLSLTFIDCLPTGLLVVENLDPNSAVLSDKYHTLERDIVAPGAPLMPPSAYLRRFRKPPGVLEEIRLRRARGD